MKAAVYTQYGPPEVVSVQKVEQPAPAADEVLVKVHATTVTTADWRLRASAFPGGLWLPGRLMTGVLAPRNKVLGGEFAGEVVAKGDDVSAFNIGDRVFGFAGNGTHAEYLTMKGTAAVARIPESLSDTEAAALPFGGLAALVFLHDIAQIRPGKSILILGASGNVGVYAVQIAKAMGAYVTAVASAENHDLLTGLGANVVLDYHATDPLAGGADYDVILDPAGVSTFKEARNALKPSGLYVPLNFSLIDVLRALLSRFGRGPTMRVGVNGDTREDLEQLKSMIEDGKLRPVIDRVLPFEQIRDAYAYVEGRHRRGSVVLEISPTSPAEE